MTNHTAPHRPPLALRADSGLRPGPGYQEVIVPKPGAIQSGQDVLSTTQARALAERQAREDLLVRLGVPTGPDDRMDQFADHIAEVTGMLYGFVNIFRDEQTFVGLHNPPPDSGHLILGRTMSLDHGWCPAVVKRQRALPLWDVHARVQIPAQRLGPPVAPDHGCLDTADQGMCPVGDRVGLGFQHHHQVVLRTVEDRLGLQEKPVPADDVGGVRIGVRRRGDGGLQLLHAESEAGFDLFGEHVHDIDRAVGYLVGQERTPWRQGAYRPAWAWECERVANSA